MNLAYVRIELARCFRDVGNLMFTLALPVAMYLLFGKAEYSGQQVGRGTIGFYVMASMGAYGAVIAATAISAQAATESMLGWGRQLALTRQQPLGFVANKVVVALVVGAVSSGLVFLVGPSQERKPKPGGCGPPPGGPPFWEPCCSASSVLRWLCC